MSRSCCCYYSCLLLLMLFVVIKFGRTAYIYETKYIDVPLDHFSFANDTTFKLKYLINNTFWASKGPIFFYTGNEGQIETFAQNTGLMWELAQAFSGLIVFAEHRYYGESLPFGNKSFSDALHWGYLTSTQALADYVYLIDFIQRDLKAKNNGRRSPVIAIGGSYGGMLSAWIRLKYPGSVDAALASSAPIFQFSGLTKCNAFNNILVSVFSSSSNLNCVKNIKNSWKTIRNVTSTDEGKSWLSTTLKLCVPLKSKEDVAKFTDWINDVYGNLAMMNYPYPTDYLASLPSYPVKEFCSKLLTPGLTGKPLLQALVDGLSVYTNYTGKTKCVSLEETSPNVGEDAWDYQACTEMIMPMCTDDNVMFEKSTWNFSQFTQSCKRQFGVTITRDDLAILEYGGKRAQYTNVIFTNGLLDPWTSGGVLKSTTFTYAIVMPNAAHHLELRASNPADPSSVKVARSQIAKIFNIWLRDLGSTIE